MTIQNLMAVVAIIGLIIMLGIIKSNDDEKKEDQAKLDLINQCQIVQYNEMHVFDCRIINKHVARAE